VLVANAVYQHTRQNKVKITNEYLRVFLVLGSIFSCGLLALCILQIPSELAKHGSIPFRFKIIIPFCLLILFLAALYSETRFWKTALILIGCTIGIILFGVVGFAIKVIIYNLLGEPISHGVGYGVILLLLGAICIFAVIKLIQLKLSN